jgi:acyl-coenzyme A thioesterase PaaI-like protein
MTSPKTAEDTLRLWKTEDPMRVVGKGHPIGDYLEAHAWEVLEREPGRMRVRARLPGRVMNPRDELFGGFTPTYVDFFALHVVQTVWDDSEQMRWQQTANLRVDYFAPITGPEFEMQGEILNRTGRTHFVEVRFLDRDRLCAVAQTTLIAER